jgi:hypothetical protein
LSQQFVGTEPTTFSVVRRNMDWFLCWLYNWLDLYFKYCKFSCAYLFIAWF